MQVEVVLLTLSLLFFASIFTDKIGYRLGVPALLLFLIVGMLFGPEGVGKWFGADGVGYQISIHSAQAIGSVALCVILFSGGLDTKLADVRPVLFPGGVLATVGVLLTAGITGCIIYYTFGWLNAVASVTLSAALLMASTMSSTDSASVFSTLRTNGVGLKHNLRPLLELESGANDPMAYALTTTMITVCLASTTSVSALEIVQTVLIQLVMGAVLGFAFGKAIISLMRKARLSNESLYPIMVLTACIFIFSITYFLKGNPYLAVYVGGVIIGNSKFTRKRQTKSFFDGLTWLSQLVMFLMLGLMVRPTDLLQLNVWLPCLIISIIMIFISRPLSVFLCMIPFKEYTYQDKVMLSWVGLKGAVPIIFAILCKASGIPHADMLFNVVFLCTLVSLLVQGTSLSAMARKLKLNEEVKYTKKLVHFDMDLPEEIESKATELLVTEEMLQEGNTIRQAKGLKDTLVVMVRHGENYFVPTASSELHVDDLLLVITDNEEVIKNGVFEPEPEKEHWYVEFIDHTKDFLKGRWRKMIDKEN